MLLLSAIFTESGPEAEAARREAAEPQKEVKKHPILLSRSPESIKGSRMDALFIFVCLGLAFYKGSKHIKNDMPSRLNPKAYKVPDAFRKLYDFVIGKGGL